MVCMALKAPDPRAKVIEDALFRFGLSYRWLAERIGKSHVAVASWLKGEAKPQKPEVWEQMIGAVEEHGREVGLSGNSRVRTVTRLTIPVIPHTVDVMDTEDRASDVYMEKVNVDPPEDGRKLWSRKVVDRKIAGQADPGDILVFSPMPYEVGSVVNAWHEGRSIIRIVGGTADAPTLVTTDPRNPEAIDKDFVIRGVAWQKVETMGRGVTRRTTYDFGMHHGS